MIQLAKLALTATDSSRQRNVRLEDVPADSSVGEVMDEFAAAMNLSRLDGNGQPLQIEARLEREGRHLHRSEMVGEALQPDDHLVLHPKVMAGARGLKPE